MQSVPPSPACRRGAQDVPLWLFSGREEESDGWTPAPHSHTPKEATSSESVHAGKQSLGEMFALSSSFVLLLMRNFDEKEIDFKERKRAQKCVNGARHESTIKEVQTWCF